MTPSPKQRSPRAFSLDDPALLNATSDDTGASAGGASPESDSEPPAPMPTVGQFKRGIRWGALFLSAMAALASLAAGLAFTGFISNALARNDWIGWTATTIAGIGVFAALVLVVKEIVGLVRLSRLAGLRRDIAAALRDDDLVAERKAVERLKQAMGERPDMQWALARLGEHERDVLDAGNLLRLTERELMVPLDHSARTLIMKSAKRVSMVTALSPFVWVAMLYVLTENLRMMRSLAALYGGRPGFIGSLKLARLVIGHIIATGGLAMTDDLLGQFLSQDLLGRLSRRLGEGMFNGAMTARVGTAAIDVTRPLPYLDAQPVRVRDLLPELLRSWTAKTAKKA